MFANFLEGASVPLTICLDRMLLLSNGSITAND